MVCFKLFRGLVVVEVVETRGDEEGDTRDARSGDFISGLILIRWHVHDFIAASFELQLPDPTTLEQSIHNRASYRFSHRKCPLPFQQPTAA